MRPRCWCSTVAKIKGLTVGETPVTFITPSGPMEIRMRRNSANDICAAAVTLKASHFVSQDGYDETNNMAIWGVFSMRGVQKGNPVPGEWTINDPIRTFIAADSDAAVMYALTKRGH